MKASTIKYVIRDTTSYKVIATIKPYRLLTAKARLNILDARGYSTAENERYRVDRYLDNEYIFTSFLPTEEEARKEEEEPTLEEPEEYDNLDDLEEDNDAWDEIKDEMNDAWDNVKYREDNENNDDYDNLDNLENYNNLRCLERLRD